MKVVLLEDVKGTGKKDQILSVSDGFARNFLFPKKWAVEASPGAIKEIERKRAADEKKERERRAEAEAKAKLLNGKEIMLSAKCGETGRLYGSITAQEIADGLAAQHGITVDKRKIDLKEPLRKLGKVSVSISIYAGLSTEMTVNIVEAGK